MIVFRVSSMRVTSSKGIIGNNNYHFMDILETDFPDFRFLSDIDALGNSVIVSDFC
jgi:hypothetical protein